MPHLFDQGGYFILDAFRPGTKLGHEVAMKFDPPSHARLYRKSYILCKVYYARIWEGRVGVPRLSATVTDTPKEHHDWTQIDRPSGRPYGCRPGGLRAGSPPSPPAALDPPRSAASPAVPALIGSGSASAAVARRLAY
jgi:hypothetical protein